MYTAMYGDPQMRERTVRVSVPETSARQETIAPMFIFGVVPPTILSEFLRESTDCPVIAGNLAILPRSNIDILQPTPLGWIHLPNICTYGSKARSIQGDGILVSIAQNRVILASKANNSWDIPKESIALLDTRYQVYSQEGIISPIGLPYPPSGMGHTIFYDVSTNKTRILSELECWLIMGGEQHMFSHFSRSYATHSIINATTPEVQLYLTQLTLGLLSNSPVGETRTGGTWRLKSPLSMSAMPRPDHRRQKNNDKRKPPIDRLEQISRLLTRFIRHGQRPHEGPELPYTPKRQLYFHHILDHPMFQELQTEVVDLHRVANDLGEKQKKRMYIRYEGSTASYLLGVYNGHSLPVEGEESNAISNPGFFCHSTSLPNLLSILKTGLRAENRNDIHLAPQVMDQRQSTYLVPTGDRKTHIIIDGKMASQAGVVFAYVKTASLPRKG